MKALADGEIKKWPRQKAAKYAGYSVHLWKPLQDGLPVPWGLLEAVAKRLNQNVTDIAEECASPPADERGPNPWSAGWGGLVTACLQTYLPEETYCRDDFLLTDAAFAARMVLEFVGRDNAGLPERLVSEQEAIALGETMMGRTHADYTQWLVQFVKKDKRTVLFAVVPGADGKHQRVATSVTIPLTEKSYKRYRTGSMMFYDFTADDYSCPTRYLYAHAVAEMRDSEAPLRNKRRLRQMLLIAYQFAAFCNPDPMRRRNRPRVITQAGTPQVEELMKAYGGHEVGAQLPIGNTKIYELGPEETDKLMAAQLKVVRRFPYDVMLILIHLIQGLITMEQENGGNDRLPSP